MMQNFTLANLIKAVWNQEEPVLSKDQFETVPQSTIASEGIVVVDNQDGTYTLSRHNHKPVNPVIGHKYQMPPFAPQVRAMLQMALEGKSCNILLYGPMGTGKTEFVNEIANEMGFRVYHVNGVEEMGEDAFFGHLTCKVDKTTGQNYTPFEKGPLYRAFIEGTEVDANGDQVLYDKQGNVTTDPSGEPKVVGRPAIFFCDEFATIRPEVLLGVFNRALEIPRGGGSRSIEITAENGKTVKSHPAMVIIFAGNTSGVGNSGRYQMGYTAQSNRMDASTLNRMAVKFEFGYNLQAEDDILRGLLNNDLEADRIKDFTAQLRQQYVNENVETLFSTRNIVSVCETAVAYRKMKMPRWLVDAVRDTIFNGLPEHDKAAFNEVIRAIWGVDLMLEASAARGNGYFYI